MPRPREFDETEAVDKAMHAFWAHGYARTSLDDLVQATGLNRSSLYNAFGGKVGLFCAALDAYRDGPAREVVEPLFVMSGAWALRAFFDGLCRFVESPQGRRGCLMVNTALGDAEGQKQVQSRVAAHFGGIEFALARAYQEAVSAREIPDELEPEVAAHWVMTFVRGVLVGAASGESPAALQRALRLTADQLGLAEYALPAV